MSDGFVRDERQKAFLGVSKEVLFKVFGEPEATYVYHEKELLYYGLPELSFVELTKGVVSKYETRPERRAAFRVQPALPVNAHIMTRYDEIRGVIVDLSVSGMLISIKQYHDFMESEEVFLKFSLPLRGETSTIIAPAAFYRLTEENGSYKVVFLLNINYWSEFHPKLTRYVMQRQNEMLRKFHEESMFEGSAL